MHDTARRGAGQPEPSWGDLRRQLSAALASVGDAASSACSQAVSPDQWAHMIAVLRRLEGPLAQVHMDDSLLQLLAAQAEERGFERGRAAARGHRKPGRADGRLRLVRSGGAALAALAVPARVLHHGAAAVKAHATAAAAPVAIAGAVTLTTLGGAALTPYTAPAATVPHQHAAVSRASAPAAAPPAPAAPERHGRHHRHRPAHRVLSFPVPPPAATPVTPAAAPAAPRPGVLDVQEASVTLRPSAVPGVLAGQLVITAVGGPVAWSASAAGLQLADADTGADRSSGGTLQAGVPEVITVSVSAAAAVQGHKWVIVLLPGGTPVTVTAAPPARV